MTSAESMSASKPSEELILPPQLENLSKLIAEKPEALATGSEDIRRIALEATQFVFDLALQTEEKSRIIVNDLLASISPSYAPQTRSQKRKRGASPSPEPETPVTLMRETPINRLFVEGMNDEQIWAQLELRAQNVCNVLDYALDGPAEEPGSDNEDEGRKLKKMRQALIDEGFDPEELEGMDFGEDDEDEEGDSEDEEDEEDDLEGEESEDEEDEDDGDDAELGEDVQELRDPSDDEDDDEPEIGEPSFLNGGKRTIKIKPRRGGHPELDDGFFDLAAFNAEVEAAESKNVSRGRLSKDDDEDSDEEDEEVDYFASVDDQPELDEEVDNAGGELFYKDFFDPPSGVKQPKVKKATKSADQPAPSKGKVRFHDEVRVKKIKAKGKNLPVSTMFYEEEEDEEDDSGEEGEEGSEGGSDESAGDVEEEFDHGEDMEDVSMLDDGSVGDVEGSDVSMEDDDEEHTGYETIERLKDDLFADDDDEKPEEGMSTYEKRMAALREEIASLEAENVGKKDWTLMGEATSRSRPQNSLLEEDLEFERVMKSVPVITEEVVHSLEERIKSRILENQFDDVARKRPVDDKPFLPSRFFELQDTKSKQSLAEIYEDEYTAARTGGVAGEDRDGKLKKEHEEIEKLWENICSKLDALCNAHFTPKAPKATITTVANVAAATLESALPTTKATTTMLAPEEVYAPASSDLRARSELTPAEKRALRNKQKKAKKKVHDAIQKTAEKLGRPKGVGDVKRQKDAALKTLVKSGKGVTVVGKKGKELEGGKRGKSKS
ncbi:U3 small nucleolar ribonucleoprotein complex, subunit Mpp10 [Cubamyces lactineus]|nr:U3 small nucleolar ribonucleoprotein complex, subunit Mpp10 [Cubamyces lactineus]